MTNLENSGSDSSLIAVIIAGMLVPPIDSAVNILSRDVVGNKADTANETANNTSSLMRYSKGLLAVLGTRATAIHAGAVDAVTTVVGYIKQLVTDVRIIDGFHDTPGVDVNTNLQMRDVIGNKQDAASLAAGAASIIGLLRWIIAGAGKSIEAIYDLVNAMLRLQETGGTLTATGGADNIYVNNAPAGIFSPGRLFIDLDNMIGGDSVDIDIYYRITPTGGLQLYDTATYAGVDGGLAGGRKLIKVDLDDTRYGIQVTLTQTAGVMRDYDWDVSYKA